MGLREPFAASEATHRVVTRQPSGVDDADPTGRITVENRVVDAAMRSGTAVHLSLDETSRLEAIARRLDRVRGSDRVLSGSGAEYRAALPDDAAAVRSLLAVEPGDTDAWLDRCVGVEEIVVRSADAWLYRSVPHHAHVRQLNADGREGLLAAVADALEPIPRSTVVPIDGLVSWRTGDYRYELRWDHLRRTDDPSGPGGWTVFELERLRSVRPLSDRPALALRWRPHAADSLLRRACRRLLDPETVEPPPRLSCPDRDALGDAIDSLERLRDELEYSFSIDGDGT